VSDQRQPPSGQGHSRGELSPEDVITRLAVLRQIAFIERDEAARTRLAQERPSPPEPFALAVQRGLHELRTLCALASHLHRAPPSTVADDPISGRPRRS
jgi:hypothetical protein